METINNIIETICKEKYAWNDVTNKYLCCQNKKCKYIKKKEVQYTTNHIEDIQIQKQTIKYNLICGIYHKT